MRVLLDGTVAEAYWQGGRVAMTVPTSAVESVAISSSGTPAKLLGANSYSMGDVHTTVQDVLRK